MPPTEVTFYPPAKVNLGLYIQERLPSGYHRLETVLYPLPQLHDVLTVTAAPHLAEAHFTLTGMALPPDGHENLCLRAWRLLKEAHPALPAVSIHLTKKIPAGAGLGGGSADAAYTLRACAELFPDIIKVTHLHSLAAHLGSDVPFFLGNGPMLASGTGTDLVPITVPGLTQVYTVQWVTPPVHSATAEAYRALTPADFGSAPHWPTLLAQPPELWPGHMHNAFERSVFQRYPQLAQIKEDLYRQGAVYASLSGSGAALFGIFKHD